MVPVTVVIPSADDTSVITGKFCFAFAPESVSPSSFGVTPSKPRSMPSPPFAKIELPTIRLPLAAPNTVTPAPAFCAIVFAVK